ncbi:thioredoxin domain-containing protein [Sulfurimonas sp.]
MKKVILLVLFIFLNANELKYSTSPYLQQHKNNPVNWHIWSKKTFELAKKENKPLFVSIGYSTCHWCHVMAKESFENKKIAKLLNANFISIKVDREEVPQLDSFYQNIYLKTKHHIGGWPLSIFMTPDKKVFYIASYIPPKKESYSEGFYTLIPKLHKLYGDKKMLYKRINKLNLLIKSKVIIKNIKDKNVSAESLSKSLKKSYDEIYIGFGKGRKFPQVAKIDLMMDIATLMKDKKLQQYSLDMLDVMAMHGIYDQVGGGFFRYSVDPNWEIPHFEKMLYSQAELISLYTRGYILRDKALYKNIVTETIAMVEKHFLKDNLYFSASSADSDGEEGGYFTFKPNQVKNALKFNPHASEIEDDLGFGVESNFNDKIHINFETKERPKGFTAFRKKLMQYRTKKEYPFIDKKINTAWNAMMIEALYKASYIDVKYLKKADIHLVALKKLMFKKGELYHQTILGVAPKQKGLLEDYSFLIAALISGYEVTYNEKKLDFAEYLLSVAKEKFYKNGIWYLSNDTMLIKADLNDKYYTSAQSKMIQNILKLAALKASFKYEKLAKKSIKNLYKQLLLNQANVPALAKAYLMQKYKIVTLKSSKYNLIKNIKIIKKIKYPYLLTKSVSFNKYLACTLRQCFSMENNITEMVKMIDSDIRK